MAAIWKKEADIAALNKLSEHTMGEVLDMKFVEVGDNYIKASMPVDNRTHQPYGLLHGGASAALAETVGSVASALCINDDEICVGIEINCNHIRGKRSGLVVATAEPLHIGATTHVWDIKIRDEREKLVCVSRLTVAVLKNKQ